MIKRLVRKSLRALGYDLMPLPPVRRAYDGPAPAPVEPIWPLPRVASDDEIRREFARFPHWHFPYEFEGGLAFELAHNQPGLDTNDPRRPFQRFRHFMPYAVASQGGSLKGKRVLDIACNSGFWSFQCALLGADVVGFDARPSNIEQAQMLQRVTGIRNVRFQLLDFWDMTPEALGGQFDLVLNFGVLYHLPKPLEAIERTIAMTRKHILLDTATHPSSEPVIWLRWETPFDIRAAVDEGVVTHPTRAAMEMMLRHLKVKTWEEIPVRTNDLPLDYRTDKRATWLIEV